MSSSNASARNTILFIQNDETDPPHLVGQWLAAEGFTIANVKAYAGELIPSEISEDVAGIIPLGGHMNANEDALYPFLTVEKNLLRKAVEEEVPVFAICLGTQLLAVATGGKVEQSPQSEIGIFDIELNDSAKTDSVFNFASSAKVTQWHEDVVTELPAGATLLASSPLCTNQVYRIGATTYGVQFHPEVDSGIIRGWEEHADHALQMSEKRGVEAEVAEYDEELARIWQPALHSWAEVVRDHWNRKA